MLMLTWFEGNLRITNDVPVQAEAMTSELSLAEGGGLLDLGVEQLLYLHHTTNLSFNASTLQHLCGLASNQSEVGEVCGAWHESGPPIPEYVMTIIQVPLLLTLMCILTLPLARRSSTPWCACWGCWATRW
jgi:hypothetical protein